MDMNEIDRSVSTLPAAQEVAGSVDLIQIIGDRAPGVDFIKMPPPATTPMLVLHRHGRNGIEAEDACIIAHEGKGGAIDRAGLFIAQGARYEGAIRAHGQALQLEKTYKCHLRVSGISHNGFL
jgi:hypothetical protein